MDVALKLWSTTIQMKSLKWLTSKNISKTKTGGTTSNGVPESNTGVESWEESEEIVKSKVKEALKVEDNLVIELAHRVGQRKHFHTRRDGSVVPAKPRPIFTIFQSWKQKEAAIKKARKLKPQDVKFVEDFSQKMLLRWNQQIPDLKKARDDGKIAFLLEETW